MIWLKKRRVCRRPLTLRGHLLVMNGRFFKRWWKAWRWLPWMSFINFGGLNPEANFDYLNENKEAYLSFCEAQKAKEDAKAASTNPPTDQENETLAAEDESDLYKELRTPAV
uniref:Uncharacterized protein n=1 Tax=Cannabis sativa TaxID=3483 RepID=A0A803PYQ1_CANSA